LNQQKLYESSNFIYEKHLQFKVHSGSFQPTKKI